LFNLFKSLNQEFVMSKLNSDILEQSINNILCYSRGETITVKGEEIVGKQRKFVETVEIQIGLKNYDPAKDKRFNGTTKLPFLPRPNLKVCVLGTESDCVKAKAAGLEAMNEDDLKKLNKNKRLVKALAGKFDIFLASQTLVKKIPRLLGPGLSRAGKFPSLIPNGADILSIANEARGQIKFQMKKALSLNAAVGHVGMSSEELNTNIQTSCNFLVSLLKKNWQNINVIYIKSTMGPPQQIFF
jgi:large subunit ribosomal protein L10Ae